MLGAEVNPRFVLVRMGNIYRPNNGPLPDEYVSTRITEGTLTPGIAIVLLRHLFGAFNFCEESRYRSGNPVPEHFYSKEGPEKTCQQSLEEETSRPDVDVSVGLFSRYHDKEPS